MTEVLPAPNGSFLQLADEITRLLREHPLGDQFTIVFKPETLELTDGEVLVQSVDPELRRLVLEPKSLRDLANSDVLHSSQVVAVDERDRVRGRARCLTIYPDGRNCRHIHN